MRKLMFSIALALAAGSPVLADELADAVAAIPGTVERTELVGNWTIDDKQGAYRVVIARSGPELADSRLFVQWLEMGEAGAVKLRQSVEISELAELHVDIIDYFAESDDQGLSIFIDTLKTQNDASQTYELFVFAPDDYKFGPASN